MRVLVHTCDPELRGDVAAAVRCAGHQVIETGGLRELEGSMDEEAAQVAIVDLSDPGAEQSIRSLCRRAPGVAILAVGHEPGPAAALGALRAGARGFLRKPFDVGRLERALAGAAARPGRPTSLDVEFIAEDEVGRELMARLDRAAGSDATVLLSGESGSGKTRSADWIHRSSRRHAASLLFVPCADLQGPDAAAQLLGREDAAGRRTIGHFESAHGGTLVLEDVDELSLVLQAALLNVLQARRVRSVDGSVALPIDVRVIATTRRDLAGEASAGRFRHELLERLDVIPIAVPPLRERPDDVAPLALHFLARFAVAAGDPPARLDARARAALAGRPYPGNAHELENLMRRAALLFPGQTVVVDQLDGPLGAPRQSAPDPLDGFDLRALERDAIQRSLRATRGNRTAAARALGISVRTLRNKIRRYQLT
ncbi:MAG: sigma-54-dependent transcriptional regulator [Myxococcota bacterium]